MTMQPTWREKALFSGQGTTPSLITTSETGALGFRNVPLSLQETAPTTPTYPRPAGARPGPYGNTYWMDDFATGYSYLVDPDAKDGLGNPIGPQVIDVRKLGGAAGEGAMTEYQRASLTQGAAQEQARLAWEQQQAGREEQRWAGEQEYNQQVTTAQARLSNLRAQLEAQVGIVPHMVSTEGEYMAGFGPGGMGERFGIPPVKPAYVDISGTVNQMQNVQMPQINWREYLGGQ